MKTDDFSDNTDSSDDDYNPGGPAEVVSEVDSDGEPEDPLSDTEEFGKRGTKRKKKMKKVSNKKGNTANTQEKDEEQENANKPAQSQEEKKKHADSLWDIFKKDTGFKTTAIVEIKPKNEELTMKVNPEISENDRKTANKVKVTQIFEFAGEEVRVEKEVSSESAEARLLSKTNMIGTSGNSKSVTNSSVGLKGIGSVLNQLGKKQKLSTLEKTKLDWDRFKKDENIEEELKAHTKGKDSYLDRQDFLERADLRRFEIEREVRAIERNKRLNNVPQ